tara:strand:- start:2640 stop:3560 length:921 start_codon:yes stop_codon:yes gene_type:complete
MNNYGRRLKRFLLLKRKKIDLYGGIEKVFPNKITGWLFCTKNKINELNLYIGPHLISKSIINMERKDVSDKYNCQIRCGFEIKIPAELPIIDLSQDIKLIASISNKKDFEIKCLEPEIDHKELIRQLIKTNLNGACGHFDGENDSHNYTGWAAKPNNSRILSVWLHCKKKEPLEVRCSKFRNDLEKAKVKSNSGFEIKSDEIPIDWVGKTIGCTFDEKGIFDLPQLKIFIVKKFESKIISDFDSIESTINQEFYNNIPTNFQDHWNALEEFNLHLNEIENYINESQKDLSIQKNKPLSIFKKLFNK